MSKSYFANFAKPKIGTDSTEHSLLLTPRKVGEKDPLGFDPAPYCYPGNVCWNNDSVHPVRQGGKLRIKFNTKVNHNYSLGMVDDILFMLLAWFPIPTGPPGRPISLDLSYNIQ